jgi:hypothetical protein
MNLKANRFSPEQARWWSVRPALLVVLIVSCSLCAVTWSVVSLLPEALLGEATPLTSSPDMRLTTASSQQ